MDATTTQQAPEKFEVIEFLGTGDPYFGGSADDRPLGKSGTFLPPGERHGHAIAQFPSRAEAEVAAAKATAAQGKHPRVRSGELRAVAVLRRATGEHGEEDMANGWPEMTQSPKKTLTFCRIDGPSDQWGWAIVTGYDPGPDGEYAHQPGYAAVRMMFIEGYEPFRSDVERMLAAMEGEG